MVLMQVLQGFLDGKPILDKERRHHCYGCYGLWCFFKIDFIDECLIFGTAETWASIARNLLANDYAFALFSVAEAKIVQQQLSKLQIQSIIDPMAGTGL